MRNEVEKIDELINRKKIKKITFIPSKIEIWEIKSNTNNNSYWIDLNKSYCSCKGFYYNFIKKICYHISAVSIAIEQNRYQFEFLKDSELNNYLNNLIENLMNNNI
ncbi:MAG: SWIM zinc finger family protein [Candidatus Nitrosocosmicus sp.]